MPSFCCVIGCSARAERDRVRFFRIPAAFKDRGYRLNALSKERRSMWIKCLKRGDLTETFLKNARICSKHFIDGAPAKLGDTNNPDWVPSINLGYTTIKTENIQASKQYEKAVQQSEEKSKCLRALIEIGDIASTSNRDVHHVTDKEVSMNEDISATKIDGNSVSFAVQTDLTMEKLSGIFMDQEFCSSER